ncbi:Carnitine O-palmitoyltransferase 2, mitochondrial [Pseudolycoriella hygida]|uniref:Carnitine O-palmitoyltransferase 2, mitochondrial n=1 Tax=Pseudolycoriella hygida TaxID=35572 RepID=A0A9Q0MZV9_9DIPT|nr:Carnitine O-palmitoyltransferase 2, mitochondrial [Pseudolycoriella hygida]
MHRVKVSTDKLRVLQLVRWQSTQKTTSSYDSDSYQYLQKSETPMLHFQPSLRRLAIPKLEKTCERYLAALKPILNDNTYSRTSIIVDQFRQSEAPQLQKLLVEHDKRNKHTSYISEPWFDMYLKDRAPLPINYNPVLMMKPDERPEYNDLLVRASNFIISSLRFRRSLKENLLKPEVYHMNPKKSDTKTYQKVTQLTPSGIATYVSYAFNAFPLDMSQYQGLFGATRIPEMGKDRIYREADTKHLVIIKDGHFFSMDVLDEQGNIEAPEVIEARLKYILSQQTKKTEHPVAVLTTENRDTWAKIRSDLVNDGNAEALKTIDSAIFVISFEDGQFDESNPTALFKQLLGGCGYSRWCDKSLSLVFNKDGSASVSFEHSWGDGVAVLRYFNELYSDTKTSPFVHPETKPADKVDISRVVRPIEFTLTDRTKQAIKQAQLNHQTVMDSLNMNFMKFESLDKKKCKTYRLSPDSIMQLGFQLAYKKQTNRYVGTYESCSTSAFRHGRTETIRPCTQATKQFCDAILSKDRPSNAELRSQIDQCSKIHGQLTKEAAMGQGFDRHLFGLRHMARTNGIGEPALYADDAYKTINHNILSTSTLASPALMLGGFGPVVQDGYGIGYSIQDEFLGTVFTNYAKHTNGSEFVDCLREAFNEITNIVQSVPKTAK